MWSVRSSHTQRAFPELVQQRDGGSLSSRGTGIPPAALDRGGILLVGSPLLVSFRPQFVSRSAHRLLRKCSLSAGSLRSPPMCLISAVSQTPVGV